MRRVGREVAAFHNVEVGVPGSAEEGAVGTTVEEAGISCKDEDEEGGDEEKREYVDHVGAYICMS